MPSSERIALRNALVHQRYAKDCIRGGECGSFKSFSFSFLGLLNLNIRKKVHFKISQKKLVVCTFNWEAEADGSMG